jgi:hypothetical protein
MTRLVRGAHREAARVGTPRRRIAAAAPDTRHAHRRGRDSNAGVPRPGKTVSSLAATATAGQSFRGNAAIGGGPITFFGPVNGSGGSGTEQNTRSLMPRACIAQRLQVQTTPTLVSGSVAVTLRHFSAAAPTTSAQYGFVCN